MNRRSLFAAAAGAAGSIALAPRFSLAADATPVPGAIPVELEKEFRLGISSVPIKVGTGEMSLISLGTGTLSLDDESRLTATIRAGVQEYSNVDYWLSLAAFDKQGTFLGAATHRQAVQYIRLGVIPTLLPELKFDFGISKKFDQVALLCVAISYVNVPPPG